MDLAFWEISVVYFVMQMKESMLLLKVLIGPKMGQNRQTS